MYSVISLYYFQLKSNGELDESSLSNIKRQIDFAPNIDNIKKIKYWINEHFEFYQI